MSEVKPEVKKVSKKSLWKACWFWMFFSNSCYNYELLMATSFAGMIAFALKDLYPNDKKKLGEELEKHTVFFNTEPKLGSVIHGVVISMEEQRANGAPVSADMINGVKTGLMGPFAGIGDTLQQGIIVPVLLAVALDMAKGGNIVGPIFYVIAAATIVLGYGCFMFFYGYRLGTRAIERILSHGMANKILKLAGVLGCTVLGGLVSNFVKITSSVKWKTSALNFVLQTDFFDKIMPGMLSLTGALLVFWMVKKGVSPNKIILGLVVVGAALNLLGILGPVPAK